MEKGQSFYESSLFSNFSSESADNNDNNIILKDEWDLFCKDDNLQDDNMLYCSKCQKHEIFKQKLQIYKSPIYLIIH